MPSGISFTVLCNGTDITQYVDMETLTGTTSLTERLDQCQFTIRDPQAALSISGKQDLQVIDQSSVKWFGGLISGVVRHSETPLREWDITAQGYGCLLDGRQANIVYNNQTDVAMITDLLSQNSDLGITLSSTVTPTTVDHMAFPYKPLSNCIDDICNRVYAKYYVDPNKVLHYLSTASIASVLSLTDNSRDTSGYAYEVFNLTEDATQIQNRVTVIGGTYTAQTISNSFTGTGSQTLFTLSHRPNAWTSITVGGVAQEIGHVSVNTFGDSNGTTVLVDDALQTINFQTAPGASVAIVATYNYQVPVIVQVLNQQSINQYGAWDGKVTDSAVLTTPSAIARAQSVLAQYAFSQWQGTCTIRGPYIRSGQGVHILNQTDGINQAYLVSQSTWNVLGGGVVTQDLTFIG
jgi:hypothetical protein